MSRGPRSFRTVVAASAVAVIGSGGLLAAGVGASAAVPSDGLLAEYLFDQASGGSVPNTVADSELGAATVHNVLDADWTGTSLTMRGGAKTSSGNWVELPEDLLAGAESATVIAEVKASAAMLNGFHFLWNIGNDDSATEYFFASLNCGSGRSPLVGIKSGGDERLVQASSCGISADRWLSVASVIDGDAGTATLYIDGVQVASGAVPYTPADVADQSLNTIGRAPWPDPLFQGALAAFRVYDRAITAEEAAGIAAEDAELNAEEIRAIAQGVLDDLNLTGIVTDTDVDLPTAGGAVTWSSDTPDLVADDGTVNPPLAGEPAASATLTATVSVRGQVASQQITVTVNPSSETAEERAQRLAARFVIPPVLASGTALPGAPEGATVAVTSVAGERLSVTDGVVSSTSTEPATGQITVAVTDTASELSVTRVFTVTVLPADSARELLAYHRVPTSAAEANNADVALSMHLALADGDDWSPLNENYGIFFAATSTTPPASGTTGSIIRSLRDPHLFYLADGSFGIVATRTARGGDSDGTQASSLLLARSTDLLQYEEIGLIDLGVSTGVNDAAVVYDSAAEHYLVSWTSDSGVAMHVSFADLTDPATRSEPARGSVDVLGDGAAGTGVPNLDTGNVLPVSAEVAQALTVRFGRISNITAAPFDDIVLALGEEFDPAELPVRVELGYDDGSTGSLGVTWDAESIEAVDTATAGVYELTGTVRQQIYPEPFADERADPAIVKYDWNGQTIFLMIATEDLNLNPINPANGPHMPIRIAGNIDDLSDEAIRDGRNEEIDLLVAGSLDAYGNAMTGCFWAPEFHVIDDTLSILFMPCYDGSNNQPDMWTGRASVIQLGKDADGADLDPADPDNWTAAEHVLRADGSILNPIQNISLDMTYFEDSGQSYYAWQMLGAVFIATMDPSDPTRLTSEPQRIVVPEYAWDNTIAEGPNVHIRDGVIHMIYSGSTVGDTYTTGLVTAPAGVDADLTQAETWTKLNYPIQKSGIYNDEWQLGPGHGMWSEDEDGNLLYVFHARTHNLGLSGRDTFIRRVHWAADGMPIFDMFTTEELASQFREVSLRVVVEDDGGEEPGEDASLTLSRDTVYVGGDLGVTGEGFAPGETVEISLSYGPVQLASVSADDEGSFEIVVTIPAGTEPGAHVIEAIGLGSDAQATAPITVLAVSPTPTPTPTPTDDPGTPTPTDSATTPSAPTSPGDDGLPGTGVDAPWWLAAALLVAGAALTSAAWRRRTATP